jgi:hypothetical protein
MPSPRLQDWRTLLSLHIEDNRLRPFEWGKHDCALWVADCLEVMTGVDPAPEYRDLYDSPLGALKAIRRIDGCPDLDGVAVKRVKHVAFAMAGDAVAADLSEMGLGELGQAGLSLGICFGATSYFVGENGLVGLRTLDLENAYG